MGGALLAAIGAAMWYAAFGDVVDGHDVLLGLTGGFLIVVGAMSV